MSDRTRNILLAASVVLIAVVIVYLQGMKARPSGGGGNGIPLTSAVRTDDFEEKARKFYPAKEIVSPSGFLNTGGAPLALKDIVGKKVILLDFWTYSCINCQRTLPYLTSWYEKYKDQGLEIVSIHTPEFAFEKEIANVEAAAKKFGVTYPIVLDNDYATWDAYQNQYWPEHYLIDINGLVVDRHIGEGGYDETEQKIQALLKERKEALGEDGSITSSITQVDQQVAAQSPETYFGWSRNTLLGNGKAQSPGLQTLALPDARKADTLYLGGAWDFSQQYASNVQSGARISFRYTARDVYFVGSSDKPVSLTILRDGQPVGARKGDDVAADGTVTVQAAGLYKLIHEDEPGTHAIEIIVNDPGLKAFTFTFG